MSGRSSAGRGSEQMSPQTQQSTDDAKGGKKTAAKRTSRSGNPAKRSQG
ncbi:cell division protein CrgA, partial [Burkholderia multivorans]